jgi:hypothetical protein
MRRAWTVIILSLSGCNAGGLGVPRGDGDAGLVLPTQGFYQIEAKANEDTCRPHRFVGVADLEEPILTNPQLGIASLPYPSGPAVQESQGRSFTSFGRQALRLSDGLSMTHTYTDSECGTTKESYDLQTLSSDGTHLQLDLIEDFQTETPCTDPTKAYFPATCHSDRLITYTLVQPCPAPEFTDGGMWHCGN